MSKLFSNRILFAVFAAVMYSLSQSMPAAAETVVFDHVQIVTMRAPDEVLHDQRLVIDNEHIVRLGPAGEIALPAGARVIAGAGGYLIPGLTEMHAHVPPERTGEQRARDVLMLYLANGITTVRGMLGEPWHLELRPQLAGGEWEGPRLITSGPSFNGNSVDGPAAARRMVRAQAAAGYDFLKLHPGLGPLEYEAITTTAKAAGITFAGHVSTDVGIARTLSAKQATIDHLDGYALELLPPDSPYRGRDPGFFGIAIAAGLDGGRIPELAEATAKAGVWNVPTESLMVNILGETPVEALLSRPEMIYVDAATADQWRRAVEAQRSDHPIEARRKFLQLRKALLLELHHAGAGLLLGSDAPQIMNVPGFSLHQELALMVEAGLTSYEALAMGTRHPAQFFSAPERGTIAEGQLAELVLLAADPLTEIANSRKILGVYRQGRWFDRALLDARLAAIAQRAAAAPN